MIQIDILMLILVSLSSIPVSLLMIYGFTLNKTIINVIIIFNLIYPLLCYVIIKYFLDLNHKNQTIKEQNKYIDRIRKQRHDFSNHLQTIYVLISTNELDHAKKYIDSFNVEYINLSSLNSIKKVKLQSYLNTKIYEAINNSIDFHINAYDDLIDMKTSGYNLIKILSNLLDNAFQHVLTQESYKFVVLDILKEDYLYIFTVTNSGSIKNIHTKMFGKGFTTKASGNGFGLVIVQEVLEVCNGKIEIVDLEPVVIRVMLP